MTEHRIIDNIEYKQCSCCHEFKQLQSFQKRKDSKDGYRDKCVNCLNVVKNAWLSLPKEQITHKICSKCNQDKNISEYTINNSSIDGYAYVCKSCQKQYKQEHKTINNTTVEQRKAYYNHYKQNCPDKIEQWNKNSLKYYYQNKDRILEKQREKYKQNNKETINITEQKKQQKELEKQQKLEQEKHRKDLFSRGFKICNCCKQIKPISEYYKSKSCLDGYNGQCKACLALKDKQYQQNLTPEQKEQRKQYLIKYTAKNKDRIKQYQKQYKQLNTDKIKEADRLRYEENKLNKSMSVWLHHALKENKAERHWEDLVPYNLQQLREHLESQFTPEMNWDNQGSYWEIDHIIPQNLFKFETEKDREFQICWSLMNLRPLEKIANRQRPKDGSDISQEVKDKILNQIL